MAIVLDTAASFGIDSWTGLRASIALWLDRDDLTDRIPDFIRLAEARFRRDIVRTEQEKTVTLPGPLPADCDSVRTIYLTDTPTAALEQVSPAELRTSYSGPATGRPTVYALIADQIVLGPPSNASYSAFLTYLRKIPALSASLQSNWLLVDHPDLYLYGSLLHAELYGWNDERLPLLKSAVDEAIVEINAAGHRRRYGGGPIVARPNAREPVRGAYR